MVQSETEQVTVQQYGQHALGCFLIPFQLATNTASGNFTYPKTVGLRVKAAIILRFLAVHCQQNAAGLFCVGTLHTHTDFLSF